MISAYGINCSEASLYIHIPFCKSLCDYCDFYSIAVKDVNEGFIDSFINALINDIKNQINLFGVKKIPSLYIGGGTPSVLGNKIRILLDALKNLPHYTEFTIEANPESITEEFLDICRDYGINRLSLGIQTFHEQSRLAVNRTGDAAVLEDRIDLASQYFPDMLSVDLITGLPYQDRKIVLNDIKRALAFCPSHVSLYSLSVEEGTPLKEKIRHGTVTLPDSDTLDSIWLTGREALLKEGFEHYEVSNFARQKAGYPASQKRCLHNIRYWQMRSWLGAGPAACGTVIDEESSSATRFTYADNVEEYLSKQGTGDSEQITRDTFVRECLLMGFRYIDGPDTVLFKQRFGFTIEDCIGKTLEKWKAKNKMLFLNSFIYDAFSELENVI